MWREADQTMGVRQGCGISPYLINVFMDDITDYFDGDNASSPVVVDVTVLVQLT